MKRKFLLILVCLLLVCNVFGETACIEFATCMDAVMEVSIDNGVLKGWTRGGVGSCAFGLIGCAEGVGYIKVNGDKLPAVTSGVHNSESNPCFTKKVPIRSIESIEVYDDNAGRPFVFINTGLPDANSANPYIHKNEDGPSGSAYAHVKLCGQLMDNDGDTYIPGDGPNEDCNDNDASIHPGANELCDGIEFNCDDHNDRDLYATIMDAGGLCIDDSYDNVEGIRYSISPGDNYHTIEPEEYAAVHTLKTYDENSFSFSDVISFSAKDYFISDDYSGEWRWYTCAADTDRFEKSIPESLQVGIDETVVDTVANHLLEESGSIEELSLYYECDFCSSGAEIGAYTEDMNFVTTTNELNPYYNYLKLWFMNPSTKEIIKTKVDFVSESNQIIASLFLTGYEADALGANGFNTKTLSVPSSYDLGPNGKIVVTESVADISGSFTESHKFVHSFNKDISIEPSTWTFSRFYTQVNLQGFVFGDSAHASKISGIKFSENIVVPASELEIDTDSISHTSCCPSKYCWNGTSCVQGYSRESNVDFNIIGTDDDLYACVLEDNGIADWALPFEKTSQYNRKEGYCIKKSQCLYYDSLTEESWCIDSHTSPNKNEDLYCLNGNWNSRTSVLSQTLADSYRSYSSDMFISCAIFDSDNPECVYFDQENISVAIFDYKERTPEDYFLSLGYNGDCPDSDDFVQCTVTKSQGLFLDDENVDFNVYYYKPNTYVFSNIDKIPQFPILPSINVANQILQSTFNYKTHGPPDFFFMYHKINTPVSNPEDEIRETTYYAVNSIAKDNFKNAVTNISKIIPSSINFENYYDVGSFFTQVVSGDSQRYLVNSALGVSFDQLANSVNKGIADTSVTSGYNYYKKCLLEQDSYKISTYPDFEEDEQWHVQTMMNEEKEQGCCSVNDCWSMTECVSGFDKTIPIYNDETRLRYDYGEKNQIACVKGKGWTDVFFKQRPDGKSSGYCFNNTQCWIDEDMGCIDSGEYYEDFYCDDGKYSTRTSQIAIALINDVDIIDNNYVLYCDNYSYSLNDPFPGLNDLNDKINSVCVIESNDKTIIGFSSNSDELLIDDIVERIEQRNADDIYNDGQLDFDCTETNYPDDGDFYSCNDDVNKLWYNNHTNSYIITRYDYVPENTLNIFEKIFDVILHPIRNFMNMFYVELPDDANFDDISATNIYINTKENNIYGSAGYYNGSEILVALYDGYEFNICDELGNEFTCSIDNGNTNISTTNPSKINEYWHSMTARLRP